MMTSSTSLAWIRSHPALVAVAAVAALAGTMTARWWAEDYRSARPLAAVLAAKRGAEARLTWPDADRYRPLQTVRTDDDAGEAIPEYTLAALERRGDPRAAAAAALLAHERARAAAALAHAGDSADLRSDRAAVALASGEASQALTLADAALAAQPSHPQAAWNRALALRDLGLPLAAAAQLDAVAQLGEPGWSDEARARAASLRADANARARAWHALVVDGKLPPAAASLRASLRADTAAAALAEARRHGWWGVERDALSLLSHATPMSPVAAAYAAEASLRATD